MINSEYWLNLKNMWTNFPNRETDALLKWYTLAQLAFWVQQFLVLHIEKPRKDHWQMFAHHVVTTLLISCSYCYHQTRVSNLILCTMDVVDLFFPVPYPDFLKTSESEFNTLHRPRNASNMQATTPFATSCSVCSW